MAFPSTFFLGLGLFFSLVSAQAQSAPTQTVTASPPVTVIGPQATVPTERIRLAPYITVPAANPQNAALLALKNEQIAMWEDIIARLSPLQVVPEYQKALDDLRTRARALQKSPGDAAFDDTPFQERAYFAANDGSPQPYYVMLPDGYTPTKKWPLVVFLHGYATALSKINPWIPLEDVLRASAKRGFIFVIPYGRRNSDFVDWGEDDVRAVRDDVMAHYSVDPARMNLLGASMGAFGAYAMGLHAPGDWSAVAPISGRTDMFLWFNIAPGTLPSWKPVLLESDDPRTLILNGRNTPMYIQHGARDLTVPVEHARRFAADARAFDLPVRYFEDPNSDHESLFGLPAYDRAFDWFKTQKSAPPPRRFEFATGNGLNNRAYWARIETFEDYNTLARLDVRVEGRTITVQTQNVAKFVLEPPRTWWKPGEKIALAVNNAAPIEFDSQSPLSWQLPGAKLNKFPGHVGPFKNLLRAPFLLVYGDENDARDAQRFADEWQLWTDGAAPIKAASNITEADKAKFNLILFGTRATNPLLGQFADQLPLEITPGGYRIRAREVQITGIGLRMVWKSPWSAKRLIGVCSGLWWGENLPPNHKWDWIPDYIVYGADTEPTPDDTNRALEAGWFDGNWNLNPTAATTTIAPNTVPLPRPATPPQPPKMRYEENG